jgi:hypothetical protein
MGSAQLQRGNSETAFSTVPPRIPAQHVARTNSDVAIQQPQPMLPASLPGLQHGRVQWRLGSEG